MAKKKTENQSTVIGELPIGHIPALAMRALEKEIEKHLRKTAGEMASRDAGGLSSIETYTMLLFLSEFQESELSVKDYKALLAKYKCDTPGNLRTYPKLSQSALFEIFSNLGISRESIRRQLILLAQHGLIERVSKGPPFPDELSIAKAGAKLIGRIADRLAKDIEKAKPFAYL